MALPRLIDATGFAALGARDFLEATGPILDFRASVWLLKMVYKVDDFVNRCDALSHDHGRFKARGKL